MLPPPPVLSPPLVVKEEESSLEEKSNAMAYSANLSIDHRFLVMKALSIPISSSQILSSSNAQRSDLPPPTKCSRDIPSSLGAEKFSKAIAFFEAHVLGENIS